MPVEERRPEAKEAGPAPKKTEQPATDIQAALTVIGRRAKGPGAADLNKVNIQGAALSGANLHGADLGNADLTDTRNLAQAQLYQARGEPKALPKGLTLGKPCP